MTLEELVDTLEGFTHCDSAEGFSMLQVLKSDLEEKGCNIRIKRLLNIYEFYIGCALYRKHENMMEKVSILRHEFKERKNARKGGVR